MNSHDKSYQYSEHYVKLDTSTKNFIDLVMSITSHAHRCESCQLDPEEFIKVYSSRNKLLGSGESITWAKAISSVISDIIQRKDNVAELLFGEVKH